MFNTTKAIQDFKSLSLTQQKEKLSAIIKIIQDKDPLLHEIKKHLIEKKESLNSDLCTNIYATIMSIIEDQQQKQNEKNNNQQEQIINSYKRIQEQEKQEQENLEDLLKEI